MSPGGWARSAAVALALVAGGWALDETTREAPSVAGGADDTPVPADSGAGADRWFLSDEGLLGFVEVPAGPFTMGSDPSLDPLAFDNEVWPGTEPRVALELPTFYITRHEVTVAQFRAFARDAGFDADPVAVRGPPDHPAASVSWPDAVAYARWLDRTLRAWPGTPPRVRALLGEGWHVRLPTEAQWEKAARGTDGRRFPWGEEPRRDRANFGSRVVAPVASLPCPECPYGLTDMSGNVWEWTRSPFQAYPYDPSNRPRDLGADALWVMRGGSFMDPPRTVRAAVRGGADPGVRRPFIGFRVVLSPPAG